MIVKGIISTINREKGEVEVILPEYNSVVVKPFKLYREGMISTLHVNDFVVVAVFNNDFNDCIVL